MVFFVSEIVAQLNIRQQRVTRKKKEQTQRYLGFDKCCYRITTRLEIKTVSLYRHGIHNINNYLLKQQHSVIQTSGQKWVSEHIRSQGDKVRK